MKNTALTLIALVVTTLSLYGQDGYVKFKVDKEFEDGKIKCHINEILPYSKISSNDVIDIFVGDDTINNFDFDDSILKLLDEDSVNHTYEQNKDEFIKKDKKKGVLRIDLTLTNLNDLIVVYDSKDDSIPFLNTKVASWGLEHREPYRLVIPDAPTIFYTLSSMKVYDNPNKDTDKDGVIDSEDGCVDQFGRREHNGCPETTTFFSELSWWHYVLFILGIIGAGIGIWFLLARISKGQTGGATKVEFTGGSLKEFAKENQTSLDKLIECNKTIRDDFNDLSTNKKKDFQDSLVGTHLIIERIEIEFREKGNRNPSPKEEMTIKPLNSDSGSIDIEKIVRLLGRMEQNLKNEIQGLRSGGDQKLSKENRELNEQNISIQTELDNLTARFQTLEMSKIEINSEQSQLESELKELRKKMVSVDFLKDYSAKVLDCFVLFEKVANEAIEYFNRLRAQDPKQAYTLGHLIMDYQTDIKPNALGKWKQVIEEIRVSGLTTEKEIIETFQQIETNDERIAEFKRLLFSEFLVSHTGAVMILAEALRNSGAFVGAPDISGEISGKFEKYVDEIRRKAQTIGIEIGDAQLFKSMSEFHDVEAKPQSKRIAYQNVSNLGKDAIAEIVSYGMKTEFEETKTQIIIE